MHALLNLRGSIPEFILIIDGKYHDSNALDMIIPQPGAIYLMDMSYLDHEALFRINQAGAFFVTRAKSSLRCEIVEQNFNMDRDTGLSTDRTIMLVVPRSRKLYPEKLRLVEFYDNQNDELIVFLTNSFELTPLEVANLYKNCWQIEVFKWIKQNLVINTDS